MLVLVLVRYDMIPFVVENSFYVDSPNTLNRAAVAPRRHQLRPAPAAPPCTVRSPRRKAITVITLLHWSRPEPVSLRMMEPPALRGLSARLCLCGFHASPHTRWPPRCTAPSRHFHLPRSWCSSSEFIVSSSKILSESKCFSLDLTSALQRRWIFKCQILAF